MERRTIEKRRSWTTSSSPMKDMYRESFDMYKEMYKEMYTESRDQPDHSSWKKSELQFSKQEKENRHNRQQVITIDEMKVEKGDPIYIVEE